MRILRALLLPLLAFVSVFLTVLYVFDLQKTINHASTCEMTYSWPVYTPLKWISHPKYTLYSLHQKQKRSKLTGIPLLFLPGHLGSYRQARSIGLHLYELDGNRFDVFTIDFNEELTALSGNFVMDQATFVNDAIRMILKKYKKQSNTKVPSSVVIFAHSMGGIVARTAESLPNYKPLSIQHVVSVGSPYDTPPFPFDTDIQQVYTKTSRGDLEPKTVYISLAGGHKDLTVHASSSLVDRIAHETTSFVSLTTAMPQVNATMDHLCLLWCHQLLQVVAKSLHEVVDSETNDLISEASKRLEIARTILLGDKMDQEIHQTFVREGYHATEFDTYEILTPKILWHLFRARYSMILVMVHAIVLQIISIQLYKWQNRFSTNTPTSSLEDFPSFGSLLNPLDHAPMYLKEFFDAIVTVLLTLTGGNINNKVKIQTLVGYGFLVGLVAFMYEYTRRNMDDLEMVVKIGTYVFLYLYAIGLLYACNIVGSLVLRFVLKPLGSLMATIKKKTIDQVDTRLLIVLFSGVLYSLCHMFYAFETHREAGIIFIIGFVLVMVFLLSLILFPSTQMDHQRYQISCWILYFVSLVTWLGKFVYYVDIIKFPPSTEKNKSLNFDFLLWGFHLVCLFVWLYHLYRVHGEMIPQPPNTPFALLGSMINTSNETKKKYTPEDCPKCNYPDAGPGAIFEEFTKGSRLIGHQVVLGPCFRVISCDCVVRFQDPRQYCDYCVRSCGLCGGGAGKNQDQNEKLRVLQEKEMALHGLVASAFQLAAMIELVFCLEKRQHGIFYLTCALSLVMIVYHLILRDPLDLSGMEHSKPAPKKKNKKKKKKKNSTTNFSTTNKEKETTAAKASSKTTSTTATTTENNLNPRPVRTSADLRHAYGPSILEEIPQ